MKFCCVEYTTKTRKVWVPSVEHPNYLGDPMEEIDPTSFGSYTTALRGEHVPLTGAILGHLDGHIAQALTQRLRWRLFHRWGPYSVRYFRKFDTMLCVYDWRRGGEMTDFVRQIRRAYPETVVVGVPTQPFGALREAWRDHRHLAPLIDFYESCHVVLSIVRATVPYQQAMTATPVVYLPQPYPVEYATQFWRHGRAKSHIVFAAGETARPDILAGHLAAKELQKKHPQLSIHVTRTPGSPLNTHLLEGTLHEIIPFRPWRQHLPYISSVALVINTDTWWTRGRVQADCAAVGTPAIGGTSDGQQELFPELHARDVEDFREIIDDGLRLLGDLAFYSEVTMRAKQRLKSYNFATTVKRFVQLVALARERRAHEFPALIWKNDTLVEVPKTASLAHI